MVGPGRNRRRSDQFFCAHEHRGRLHDADTATVVRLSGGEVLTTDGPFVEAKEHLGGFYIIEAADLDAALGWASKVTRTISAPIEVWPFADTAGG